MTTNLTNNVLETLSAEAIDAIGTVWTKKGSRLYLSDEFKLAALGLEVETYKGGAISHAKQHGEKISNSKATKLIESCRRAWVDLENGELMDVTLTEAEELIAQAINAAVEATEIAAIAEVEEDEKVEVIATCTNHWGDEIRILDINGTLYREEDGERTPMRFNTHDGGGKGDDGDILSHANVKLCGWEVEEDGNRNFCATVVMPSDCFNQDMQQKDDLTKEAIQAIKDWAEDDLEEADRLAEENLKPIAQENIGDDFSEWLDDQEDGLTDDEYVEMYLEDVQNYRRGYIPAFHDDDEVMEICRNYLNR